LKRSSFAEATARQVKREEQRPGRKLRSTNGPSRTGVVEALKSSPSDSPEDFRGWRVPPSPRLRRDKSGGPAEKGDRV